jgi:hypothetical protein
LVLSSATSALLWFSALKAFTEPCLAAEP